MRHAMSVFREAYQSALSSKVPSLLTMVVVAMTALAITLTLGRLEGLQRELLASIDDAGTRSITYRIEAGDAFDSAAVARIARLEAVEWVVGFGPPVDAYNVRVTDGPRAAIRPMYVLDVEPLGINETALEAARASAHGEHVVYGDEDTLRALGLRDGFGGMRSTTGETFTVSGTLNVPEAMRDTNHLLVSPRRIRDGDQASVTSITVVADRPEAVRLLDSVALHQLGVDDVSRVTRDTSEQLATLRGELGGQLQAWSYALVLGVAAVTIVLETLLLNGFVMLRRKDYGRRRALGASQALIIQLVVAQTLLVAIVGATLGVGIAWFVLAFNAAPVPDVEFLLGTWVLSVASGGLGCLLPAAMAARREPLAELRVP